ncbi:MAG: LUD domain-containing protein [Eubacteriales bacterium]|nr:LUD domain-containing protein [Eubacteriales bacterium]
MRNPVVEKTIGNLERNGFTVCYFSNSMDAKTAIMDAISPNETVGFGSSVTVDRMGILALVSG